MIMEETPWSDSEVTEIRVHGGSRGKRDDSVLIPETLRLGFRWPVVISTLVPVTIYDDPIDLGSHCREVYGARCAKVIDLDCRRP